MKQLLLLLLSLSLACAYGQKIDVQHYRFEIELEDRSDAISGKARITVKFLEPAARLELDLVSLQEEKGMVAYLVQEGGQRLTHSHRDDKLLVNLSRPAQKGEVRSIEVQYMGVPKDGLIISKNKYNDRTFFSDNWPNRARHWIPCHDLPSDKATVEFIVRAPVHYRVISNGVQVSEMPYDGKKITHWKEDVPLPTKIMVIGAARFAVARVDSSYSVPVTAWVYPQDSAKGVYDYALADDILKFFTENIGPYAYKKLANVQSKTIFGGMENANAIFYAENTVTGTRSSEALVAHEVAHQWFGNMATEKHFAHLWLSEGFATYCTNLYFERKYGADTLKARLRADREEVIAFARRGGRPVVDSTSDLMDLLNANSYQKGGWVLHMLRRETGDTAFIRTLQTYYRRFAGGNADTRDFQRVAEEVSGKNLQPFFDQWLFRPGLPSLDIRWKKEKAGLRITLRQRTAEPFTFPIELGVVHKDGSSAVHRFQVTQQEQVFGLPLKDAASVQQLIADPNVNLLYTGTVKEEKK